MTREEAIEKLKAIVPRQDHDGYKIKPSVLVDSLEALGLIKFAKPPAQSPSDIIVAILSGPGLHWRKHTLADHIIETLNANGYRIVNHDPS